MRMKRAAAISALLVAVSCSGRGPTTPPAGRTGSTEPAHALRTPGSGDAEVIRSGFTLHTEQIGVAAIVRVGREPRRDIDLDIAYYADGRRLGSEVDRLPFCSPDTDCPWGQTFVGETLTTQWRSIDEVRVSVRAGGHETTQRGIEQLPTSVDDDSVVIRSSGDEGTGYVVVFDGRTPRFGASFFTPRGGRRALTYPRHSFPAASADAFRTYFYPGRVPGSVYGPVD
jgi:hypothetical protein